jgi:tetratricopeptide (TPR) repeat protein
MLLKANPRIAELHLNLGIAYYSTGEHGEAIDAFRAALSLKPALVQAAHFLTAAFAESGQCSEVLESLKKTSLAKANPELRRTVHLAAVRCSMKLNRPEDAMAYMNQLNKELPDDPEVLYLTVHVYSDQSIRASQALLLKAPRSYQVRLLNAEALETQGKWADAAAEYRQVLQANPNLPGIHYRIGRLLLSAPESSPTMIQDARVEFEKELTLDPANAGAAYILGEFARREQQWPQAAELFSRAVKHDQLFTDAFIGLGRSLIAAKQFVDAVAPLERAVRLQPDNPAAHYHLAIAYARVGRKADSERQAAVFKQVSERASKASADLQTGILAPQKAEP